MPRILSLLTEDTPRAVAEDGLVTAPGTAPASFAAAFL
jgi:hypothetical protein